MRHGSRARIAAVGAATAGALLLAGCGAANEAAPAAGGAPAGAQVSGSIAGAGASSQAAAMQAWIAGFSSANPDATVNYDPVGSGGGREQFIAGGTAFGGTDSALKAEEELPKAIERCGGNVLELPLYISPIAIAFNLEGIDTLNLKPATIAGIFAKKITDWSDPAIAADNPGTAIPAGPITVVHRADDSGTTDNFTKYLSAVAPDVWTYEPDGEWPAEVQGEAAPQTSGVVAAIQGGTGTIGYADASQIGELGTVAVGVGSEFVKYSPEAAAKIVSESPRAEGRPEGSFALDLARDTTEAGTYPVVLVSYTLACGTYPDQETADLVKAFVTYLASEEGQKAAAENAGSAPITAEQRQQFQAAIDGIKSGA